MFSGSDFSFGMPQFGGVPIMPTGNEMGGGNVMTNGVPVQTWNAPIVAGDSAPIIPGMGSMGSIGSAMGGFGGAGKLGLNLGTANLALSGLASLGNIWASMKSLSLAKKQFQFQKDFSNANFVNSLKSYNTALSDRARSRGFTEGQSQSQIDSYVKDNQLTDTRKKG